MSFAFMTIDHLPVATSGSDIADTLQGTNIAFMLRVWGLKYILQVADDTKACFFRHRSSSNVTSNFSRHSFVESLQVLPVTGASPKFSEHNKQTATRNRMQFFHDVASEPSAESV